MALTSGEYEAQANRLRSQMGETVDKLRSNLTPSNLASEAASRVGVSELSWRGALDFASNAPSRTDGHRRLWRRFVALGGGSQAQQRGCPRGDLALARIFLFTCRHCNARVSRASGDQAARVYRRSADPCCERRGDALRRDRRQVGGCDRSRAGRLSSPAAHRIDSAGGARHSARGPLAEAFAHVFALKPEADSKR
jgi:hypothetical protein